MDWVTANRQLVAFRVGERAKEDAQALLDLPFLRPAAHFLQIFGKIARFRKRKTRDGRKRKGYTNHIERFNNTIKQKCSRLALKYYLFPKNYKIILGLLKILFAIKISVSHYIFNTTN